MFERYTEAARAAVVSSNDVARELQHNYIGTEHLLLGLLARPDTVATRALAALGISGDSVRCMVIDRVGLGTKPATGHIPFTPDMKRTLERSLSEAFLLQHPNVDTEHLLLALLREPDALAAVVLAEQTEHLSKVRVAVLDLLPDPPPDRE